MKNVIYSDYIPKRATVSSAGYDIYSVEDITLKPGDWTLIDTGIQFEDTDRFVLASMVGDYDNPSGRPMRSFFVPMQYVGMIFPRSSYGFKYGLRFANSVCIIDQDYRNNILLKVKVDEELELKKGDRFAQMIFVPWLAYSGESKIVSERVGGVGSSGQ